MTLADALQALCRLEPGRFSVTMQGYEPDVPTHGVRLGGEWYVTGIMQEPVALALLSAALQELCNSRGWVWTRYSDGGVTLWETGVGGGQVWPTSEAEPFALVLARAVVAALEAGRGG